MSELPKRKANRLSGYDYSNSGWYFVTICSKDKKHIFGKIDKNRRDRACPCPSKECQTRNKEDFVPRVKLSSIGKIISRQWQDIPLQYNSVALDEFIVMPNHLHGIIIIDDYDIEQISQVEDVGTGLASARKYVCDGRIFSFPQKRTGASPVPTLSDIIRSFKSRCAVEYLKSLNKDRSDQSGKIWQRSFYDHIIRNERSLYEIRYYIQNNPWEKEWW